MSLDHLLTAKSAQFFRPNPRRPLSDNAVSEIIKHASTGRSGQFTDRIVRARKQVDGETIRISYACFPLSSEPSFLRGSSLREKKYAFLLIIEAPEAIAVCRRNAEGVIEALSTFVVPWSYENLGGAYMEPSTAVERIGLRSMSVGGNTVKRRILEADDLAATMATAGVHRSIPNEFRARGSSGVHSVTLGSSRISRRDTRANLEDLLRWVRSTGSELENSAGKYASSFLAQFSRAVPLSELPEGTTPGAVMFDFSQLRSQWEDAPGEFEFQLAHSPRSETRRRLTEGQVLKIFEFAEAVFPIEGDEIVYTSSEGRRHVLGKIRLNANTITARGEFLERIHVVQGQVDKQLSTLANQDGLFVVTFDDPQYGYAERQLFKDSALLGSIDSLLRIFEPRIELDAVTQEKDVRATGFGVNGIFRFVEDSLVPPEVVLVCDDLGDEWADYVAIDPGDLLPKLSFIHCKHGDPSTSASALHVIIGQAIKNLSRMYRGIAEFEEKLDAKWRHSYNGSFPRIRRGNDSETVRTALMDAVGYPNTQREVILVLSSVSFAGINTEMEDLRAGIARPHVSQLLWLLANFVAACREHGVAMRIVCRP
jgi:hypothetical protein